MEIISKKTRRAFADHLASWSVLKEIENLFDDANIEHKELNQNEQVSGERRTLVFSYYKSIDWENYLDVSKVISVYETILSNIENDFENDLFPNKEYLKVAKNRLLKYLESDGFYWQDGHLNNKKTMPIASKSILEKTNILNSAQIKLHFNRIENAIDSDPDLAIGNAKELIETVCKNILDDLSTAYSKNSDLPELTKLVTKQLKITPQDVKDNVKGSEIIKRTLNNLSSISTSIAELRNLYGTGHGKDKNYKGLSPRHARLVVLISYALACFLVETYELQKLKKI